MSEKARMEGALIDTISGGPIKKGVVRLRAITAATTSVSAPSQSSTLAVQTDAQGAFTFNQLEPGQYTLSGEHPAFVHGMYRRGGERVLTIAPGQTLKDLRIGLIPLGALVGQFANLRPVDYRVLAWEDVGLDLAVLPACRDHFRSNSTTVKLQSNGHERVQLKAVSAEATEAEAVKLR